MPIMGVPYSGVYLHVHVHVHVLLSWLYMYDVHVYVEIVYTHETRAGFVRETIIRMAKSTCSVWHCSCTA